MATNPPVETERRECAACQTSWQGPVVQPLTCPRCGALSKVTPLDPLPSVTPETYSAEEMSKMADRREAHKGIDSYVLMLRYAATLARDVEMLKAALDRAANVIHGEFCTSVCNPACVDATQAAEGSSDPRFAPSPPGRQLIFHMDDGSVCPDFHACLLVNVEHSITPPDGAQSNRMSNDQKDLATDTAERAVERAVERVKGERAPQETTAS